VGNYLAITVPTGRNAGSDPLDQLETLAQQAADASIQRMANAAALAATVGKHGQVALKLDDGTRWWFNANSSATDASQSVVIAASSGAWLLLEKACVLTLPFTFATADAAVLWTAPTGCRFRPRDAWWEISANMTGGSTPAIGVHASVSGWSTKGDILGGASGDLTATLVTTNTRMTGTVGAKLDTHVHDRLIMIAGDTFNFDQITSAFAAGAGNVRISGDLLANLGQ